LLITGLSCRICGWAFNRFLYDGERIQEDDTPMSLDMEDNGAYDLVLVTEVKTV